MYYPSSENKGADQLRGYREADLRLCFRLCRLLVFPWGGSYNKSKSYLHKIKWDVSQNNQIRIILFKNWAHSPKKSIGKPENNTLLN